jgi:hypothetical protein
MVTEIGPGAIRPLLLLGNVPNTIHVHERAPLFHFARRAGADLCANTTTYDAYPARRNWVEAQTDLTIT